MKLPDLSKLPVYAKAVAGGVAAGGAAVSAALLDGHVDLGEVVTIVGAVLVGAGLVGGVKNAPKSVEVDSAPMHVEPSGD